MFADTLLRAQQEQLFRIVAWGVGSLVVGLAVLLATMRRRHSTALLRSFCVQLAGWGAVEIGYAVWGYHTLRMLDFAGATHLERVVWLNLGLDAGAGAAGLALIGYGWRRAARREVLLGSGAGLLLQGAALLVINVQLASAVVR